MSNCLCWNLAFLQAIDAYVEWFSNGHQSSPNDLRHSPGALHGGNCLILNSYPTGCRLQIAMKNLRYFLSPCVAACLTGGIRAVVACVPAFNWRVAPPLPALLPALLPILQNIFWLHRRCKVYRNWRSDKGLLAPPCFLARLSQRNSSLLKLLS